MTAAFLRIYMLTLPVLRYTIDVAFDHLLKFLISNQSVPLTPGKIYGILIKI